MKRFAAALLCAAGLLAPARATAQSTAPIELKWKALESCPKADTVLARVHKIAGASRATPNTLRAEATITQPSERRFSLRLEIHYGNLAAVRTIEGKSCKDLAGAAAVALALLLSSEEPLNERDLAGTSSTTGTTSGSAQPGENQTSSANQPAAPAPPSSPTTTNPPTGTESPESVAGPPRRWNVLLVAPLAALGIGPLPQTSRGLGIAAGFSYDRWRFLADVKAWASQRETIGHLGGEYTLELERYTVGARGCRSVIGERFELAPCLLMSVHHLSVTGGGRNIVSGSDSTTWASVGIGAQGRVLITPWLGLVAAVDGELQLSRPEVSMTLPSQASLETAAIPVRRLAPVAATLVIGPQWIF